MFDMQQQWTEVKNKVQEKLDSSAFSSWISPLSFSNISDDTIILSAPSQFSADWINNNYKQVILEIWKSLNQEITNIDFEISSQTESSNVKSSKNPVEIEKIQTTKIGVKSEFTFENFIASSTNQMALNTLKGMVETTASTFNNVFMYGTSGTGKTHLLHAFLNDYANNNEGKKITYITADKFSYEYTQAAQNNSILTFRKNIRSNDVLVIDNFHQLSGKKGTQKELMLTIEFIINNGGKVLISSGNSPFLIPNIEKDLLIQISSALLIDIKDANKDLKQNFINQKTKELNISLSNDAKDFLSNNFNASINELNGALKRLFVYSSLSGDEITVSYLNNVLKDMFVNISNKVEPDEIKKSICNFFEITITDLHSKSRVQKVAIARQTAMYLLKSLTTLSLSEIGKALGGRNHSTVLHGIKTIENMMNEDINFASKVSSIREKF